MIVRLLIGFGTESHKAVVVDECTKRIARGDECVDAQVELEAVEEQWIGNVFLHDVVVLRMDLVDVLEELDAVAHGAIRRLHDVGLLLVEVLLHFVGIRDQTGVLVRHYPRLGHKVEVMGH